MAKSKFDNKTVYMDGGINLSYSEMLYGKYGIRNKKMYCNLCDKHFKFCNCTNEDYFGSEDEVMK